MRESPESFVFVAPTKPPVPTKPIPNKDHLQKLSENPSFLNSLRAAVQNRSGIKKVDDVPSNWAQNEEVKQQTSINISVVPKQVPLPPRPPAKKPQLPPIEYDEDESQDEESVYVSPDDHSDNNFSAFTQKSLPERPPTPPPVAQSAPRKTTPLPDPPKLVEEVHQEKPIQRQPFRLGDHYSKQRQREREITKTTVENLAPTRRTTLKDVSPARRSEKGGTIPRPPLNLVRAEVPDLPSDSPEPQPEEQPAPMEQESELKS